MERGSGMCILKSFPYRILTYGPSPNKRISSLGVKKRELDWDRGVLHGFLENSEALGGEARNGVDSQRRDKGKIYRRPDRGEGRFTGGCLYYPFRPRI